MNTSMKMKKAALQQWSVSFKWENQFRLIKAKQGCIILYQQLFRVLWIYFQGNYGDKQKLFRVL